MTFEEWCEAIDVIAKADGWTSESFTEATDVDSWIEMFNDELTPGEAYQVDKESGQ